MLLRYRGDIPEHSFCTTGGRGRFGEKRQCAAGPVRIPRMVFDGIGFVDDSFILRHGFGTIEHKSAGSIYNTRENVQRHTGVRDEASASDCCKKPAPRNNKNKQITLGRQE